MTPYCTGEYPVHFSLSSSHFSFFYSRLSHILLGRFHRWTPTADEASDSESISSEEDGDKSSVESNVLVCINKHRLYIPYILYIQTNNDPLLKNTCKMIVSSHARRIVYVCIMFRIARHCVNDTLDLQRCNALTNWYPLYHAVNFLISA